jgi:DNA-binding transcriptional MerR regulator
MPAIPNKLYFRIGEVSDLVGVKPYVLRYWESEFPDIKPSKSKSGQRLYKRRDVELLLRIKGLLYEERFTINGARKRLKDFVRGEGRDAADIPEAEGAELVQPEPGPRQLEVFTAADPDEAYEGPSARQSPARDGRKAAVGQVALRDNTKTFLKIRRDLEEILALVRP